MNLPRFPIHSLTVLALAIFVYLLVAVVFFDRLMGAPQLHQISGLMIAVKVAVVRLGTIGLTVWLMQRYAVLDPKEAQEEAPPVSAPAPAF